MIVAFSPTNRIRNGLINNPVTIPILGIVAKVSTPPRSTPGKALYINGKAGEIAGAIIKKMEIDNKEILKIK